jgi:hypothetical protein
MKKTYRNQMLFAVCIVMWQMTCLGSFFQMDLDQSSIYSPSTLVVNTQLTGKAKLQGKWRVDLKVYVNKELIRKQTLPITRDNPAVFKVDFPELRGVVRGRCRSELFLDDEFIAGVERKLSVWPRAIPYKLVDTGKTFWAYDTSGSLQKIFKSIEIKAVDAIFKSARDFTKPDIIFIGENTDPNNMKLISNSLLMSGVKPVIVYLRQKQLKESGLIEVSSLKDAVSVVKYDKQADLLEGLSGFDILKKIADASPVTIRTKSGENRQLKVISCIDGVTSDSEALSSYLVMITESGLTKIYCQLPVTGDIGKNPVSRTLFFNLLDMVNKQLELPLVEIIDVSVEKDKHENLF